MPSSLPGSDFNGDGECFWCRSDFPAYIPKGVERLRTLLDRHKNSRGEADCLVGLSGGKDSSYVALKLKTEHHLKVEAFTYNHFGLTEFALENARALCRDLDIRHHVVSLKDDEHLKSFRAFFEVWLHSEKPVPAAMTCVACKHLHSLGSELAVKRRIPMVFWSACPLEISPILPLRLTSNSENQFKRQSVLLSGLKLVREIAATPGFASALAHHFGTCTKGCLGVTPTAQYLKLRYPSVAQIMYFDYAEWRADRIVATLKESTAWRQPGDYPDDWHSDCLFNIFKEYMFQKMHGVSYTDAFLSNQIRKGHISREKGWDILAKTKEFYSANILSALHKVGLDHLAPRIDLSCFDIDEGTR